MKPVPRWCVLLSALFLGLLSSSQAEVTNAGSWPDRPLVVATKESPPFAFKNFEGKWRGLSISLWEELAARLNLKYEYVELSLSEILDRVENGTADVGVAALTITPDRESRMDFTYPYFDGGLGIAISSNRESVLWGLFRRLGSWHFLSAVGALCGILFISAFFLWLFERGANPEHFGGTRVQGLGSGFWWAAVTMTTVGYGDKSPKTLGGRIVALIWMFASIILISSFTAGIASSLTASQVAEDQLRTKPIDSLVVATVERSTGEQFCKQMGLRSQSFPDVEAALRVVDEDKAQAIIYDLPLLRHHLMNHPDWEVEILPRVLLSESYAIALPPGSPFREPLNRQLLEILRSPEWQVLRLEYLGAQ
jgi:polar amino acid transport system substrate-binding protein